MSGFVSLKGSVVETIAKQTSHLNRVRIGSAHKGQASALQPVADTDTTCETDDGKNSGLCVGGRERSG